jgi:hypothetical protein
MKKRIIKPGFELIFSISLIAIFGLPVLVFGQTTKDEQITIMNGDTTINGKNIKDLSAKDRKEAMRDIGNIGSIHMDGDKGSGRKSEIIIDKQGPGSDMIVETGPADTKLMKLRRDKMRRDSTMTFNYTFKRDQPRRGDMDWRMNQPVDGAMMMGMNRRNTQRINYTTTDNDGISTHVSFTISPPSGPIGHMGGHHLDNSDNPQLEMLAIKDLNMVPEFSEGKTVLMFTLPTKAVAEVQFKDEQGNIIWSEKTTSGEFSKSFSMGLNGVYYLRVEQSGKLAVKKITRE